MRTMSLSPARQLKMLVSASVYSKILLAPGTGSAQSSQSTCMHRNCMVQMRPAVWRLHVGAQILPEHLHLEVPSSWLFRHWLSRSMFCFVSCSWRVCCFCSLCSSFAVWCCLKHWLCAAASLYNLCSWMCVLLVLLYLCQHRHSCKDWLTVAESSMQLWSCSFSFLDRTRTLHERSTESLSARWTGPERIALWS